MHTEKDRVILGALARQLISYQGRKRTDTHPNEAPHPHGAILEEIRVYLSKIIGGSGFQALLSRATKGASTYVPALEAISFQDRDAIARLKSLEAKDAARAEEALLSELLGLLFTVIGEKLTLRLLNDLWPDMTFDAVNQISKKE